ncbi:MAG: hypothetical protein WAW11_03940 [Patescibacteria group bacterium]
MFTLSGILKKDEIKEFKIKDGSTLKRRIAYLETKSNIFPIAVNINDLDLDIGKVGDSVSLDIMVYAYQVKDGKAKRALVKYYVPID